MTPIEYAAHMDELLRYVGSLLIAPPGSEEWKVGRNFALISDSERFRYVRDLLDSTDPHSRVSGDRVRSARDHPRLAGSGCGMTARLHLPHLPGVAAEAVREALYHFRKPKPVYTDPAAIERWAEWLTPDEWEHQHIGREDQ